jgi:hypothetical protein
MEVPWRIKWYLYIDFQLHQWKMGTMSYHYGNFWGSWNKDCHRFTIKDLLTWYDLLDKIIAYVKDESAKMNTLTMTLTSTVIHSYLFTIVSHLSTQLEPTRFVRT